MKKIAISTAFILCMLIFNCSFAENTDTPDLTQDEDKDIINGAVKTEKDNSGNITKVTITCTGKSDNGQDEIIIYMVTLDPKGTELGTKFDGKNVEIVGIITRKEKGEDVELWIKAMSFNEAIPDVGAEPRPEN